MQTQDALRHQMRKNLEKLMTLRDEIRLNMHLAGMDARDAWKKLEPMLHDAQKLTDDTSDISKQAIEELIVRFEVLRAELKRH